MGSTSEISFKFVSILLGQTGQVDLNRGMPPLQL
jgi:hypothetical protein